MRIRHQLLRIRRSSIARYGAASLLPRGFAVLTALIVTPLAVDRLGIVGFGYWVLATQIPSLIVSPDLGLTYGLINDLNEANRTSGGIDRHRNRLASLARLLRMVAFAWFIVGGAIALSYSFGTRSGPVATELASALVIALAAFTPGIPSMVWSRAQLSQERGHEAVLWEGLGRAVSLLVSVSVLLFWPSVPLLIVAQMLPTTVAAWINGHCYVKREFRDAPEVELTGIVETYQTNREVFRTGRYFVGMQVAYFVGTAIDPYLIGGLLDSESVAYANLIKRPFDLLPLFVTLFSTSFWPVFTRLWSVGELRRLSRIVVVTSVSGAAFVLSMSLLIVILREPIYEFLTAGTVSPRVVDLVSVGGLVASGVVVTIVSNLLNAIGVVRPQAWLLSGSAAVGVVTKWAVLEQYGLDGYFMASAATYTFLTMAPIVFLAFQAFRRFGTME